MASSKPVILAYALVSPLGTELAAQWDRAARGESGVGRLTRFPLTDDFPVCIAGEVGGVPGGIVGGVVDAADVAPAKPVEFDAKTMKDPVFVSGPNPQYTEKALEREVQGTVVVKCVVSVDGKIHDCRILRGLPFMDRAVIEALEKRRYTPATQGGRPIEVDYTFKLTLKLQD